MVTFGTDPNYNNKKRQDEWAKIQEQLQKAQQRANPLNIKMPEENRQETRTELPQRPTYTGNIVQTGKPGQTGTLGPDGKITPFKFRQLTSGERQDFARQESGLPTFEQEKEQILRNQALQRRMEQLKKFGMGLSDAELNAIQEAPINWGQALTAGAANVLPSLIGGATGGAVIGAVGGGGIGSVPGAVIGAVGGAITGLLTGVRSNIRSQQSGEIASANRVLTNARSNLRQIRMIAQSDPSKADEVLDLYSQQMRLVHKAHRKLQLETQGNLNSFMNDGTQDLANFELFLMPGGYADLQYMRLEEVVSSGRPATPEEILSTYQEFYAEDTGVQND